MPFLTGVNAWPASPAVGTLSGVWLSFPQDMIRSVRNRYGMLDPSIKDKEGLPLTCRAVFIVGKPAATLCLIYNCGLPASLHAIEHSLMEPLLFVCRPGLQVEAEPELPRLRGPQHGAPCRMRCCSCMCRCLLPAPASVWTSDATSPLLCWPAG